VSSLKASSSSSVVSFAMVASFHFRCPSRFEQVLVEGRAVVPGFGADR
jgi:hypothetical protein